MRIMYIMLNPKYISIVLVGLLAPYSANGDESALLFKSRELVAEYATLLQSELKKSMSTGGPVAAIEVCKDHAPRIAAELSDRHSVMVGRTSLNTRNADNAPDAWEVEMLTRFDSGSTLEVFESMPNGDTRYMKAIPTAAVCLVCHGEALSEDVVESLDAAYPHDQARGYEIGDIRGAFSITWPEAASD